MGPAGLGRGDDVGKNLAMSMESSSQDGGTSGVFSGWLSGDADAATDLIQLAQAASSSLGEPIGQIDVLQGDATITHVDGSKVVAAKGAPVYQGDLVATGKSGNLGIVFADKSTFALGKDGQMTLDEMVYDPSTSSGKMAVNVAEGVFSFVSGQIAKTGTEAMTVKTPVATIGVRGTAGAGKAGPEGSPNTFSMLPDPHGGQIGEMTVKTTVGVETLNQLYSTTALNSKFTLPSLPTVVQSSFVSRAFGDIAKSAGVTSTFGPTPTGPTPTGPAPTTTGTAGAAASGAQQQASARAFEQSLAQGKSPAEAMAAAAEQGANVQHVEKWDKIGIGPFANQGIAGAVTKDILDAQTGKAQGGLGVAKDPLGAGRGGTADFGSNASGTEGAKDEGDKAREQTQKEVKEIAKQIVQSVVNSLPQTLGQMANQGFADLVAFNSGLTSNLFGLNVGAELGGFNLGQLSQDIAGTFGANFASQTIGNAMNDAIAPSVFASNGAIRGEALGAFVNSVIGQSQAIFDQVMLGNVLQNAGIQGAAGAQVPNDIANFVNQQITQTITETVITQGTTSTFADTLAGTTGNDNLVGGGANTRIVMRQGTTLGGTDTVNGSSGTDEVALLELHNFQGIYNSSAKTITYSNAGATINGTISLLSIEQIFVGALNDAGTGPATYQGLNTGITSGGAETDALNSGVRLKFETTDTGYGYVLAGDTTDDTLSLDHGTSLNYNGMGHTISSTTTFGGVIFGRGGNDSITGSPTGDNIILGGAGTDTINITIDTSQNSGAGQANALYGEEDNDTFIFSTLASGFVGAIIGGTGTDIIQTGSQTMYLGGTSFGFLGVETIKNTYSGAATITVRDGILASEGGFVTAIDVHDTNGASSILQSSDATLNITGVTTMDAFIDILKAGTITSQAGTISLLTSQTAEVTTFQSGAAGGTINLYGGGTIDFSGKSVTNFTYFNGALAQNDTITTGTGIDVLDGQGGDDQLKGGEGADRLIGGTGNDILDLSDAAGTALDASIDSVYYNTTSDGGTTGDTIKWFDTTKDIIDFKSGNVFGLSATTFTGANYLELTTVGLSNGGGFTSSIDVIVVTDGTHTKAQIDTALASGVSTSGNNPGAVFVIYSSSETSNTMLAYDSAAGTNGGGVTGATGATTNFASVHVDATTDLTPSSLSDANFAVHT